MKKLLVIAGLGVTLTLTACGSSHAKLNAHEIVFCGAANDLATGMANQDPNAVGAPAYIIATEAAHTRWASDFQMWEGKPLMGAMMQADCQVAGYDPLVGQ